MHDSHKEWSRYYHDCVQNDCDVLHARFVDHRYPRHSHDYFVVALVERGMVTYWHRGAQQVAPPGHVFLINPGEPHTGESATPNGYVYRVLYPRTQHLARVASDIGTGVKIPFFRGAVVHDSCLTRLLSRFHKCLAEKALTVEAESLLLQALARLLTNHADPQIWPRRVGSERPAIRKAREYIEMNFAEDVTLAKLADLAALSPYYFARSFEREVGIPPHSYLEGVRIRKARELLDCGEPIVNVALSVGYSDQSHFTHRFKRFLGITPGQYLLEGKARPYQSSGNPRTDY